MTPFLVADDVLQAFTCPVLQLRLKRTTVSANSGPHQMQGSPSLEEDLKTRSLGPEAVYRRNPVRLRLLNTQRSRVVRFSGF